MAGHINSPKAQDWGTPKNIVDEVERILGYIDLDPCSNDHSIVPASLKYQLPTNDGLIDTWKGNIYVNPPYNKNYNLIGTSEYISANEYQELSKEDKKKFKLTNLFTWVKKCDSVAREGDNNIIALIPANVDSKPWQEIIFKNNNCLICFIKGRVKFISPDGPKVGAPMATALVLWSNDSFIKERFYKTSLGKVIEIFEEK